jgi:hypothetical protein
MAGEREEAMSDDYQMWDEKRIILSTEHNSGWVRQRKAEFHGLMLRLVTVKDGTDEKEMFLTASEMQQLVDEWLAHKRFIDEELAKDPHLNDIAT